MDETNWTIISLMCMGLIFVICFTQYCVHYHKYRKINALDEFYNRIVLRYIRFENHDSSIDDVMKKLCDENLCGFYLSMREEKKTEDSEGNAD